MSTLRCQSGRMSMATKLQIKEHHRIVVLDKPDEVDLGLTSGDSVEDLAVEDTWSALRFRPIV